MKNILLALLLLPNLCVTAKDKKDKPEPAIKAGNITATIAYTLPPFSKSFLNRYESYNTIGAHADYQVSRGFNVAVKYLYHNQNSKTYYYKSFGGEQIQRKSYEQWNVFMAYANYCYLNRGRVRLSTGIGIGYAYGKFKANIIDSNGKPYTYYDGQKNGGFDIRIIDATVRIKNNLSLYGSFGIGMFGAGAVGASYSFASHTPVAPNTQKRKRSKPEPAFSKGALSIIATYGTLSIFSSEQGKYYNYPGNFGIDAQYQLSPKFNVGLHYGYVSWKSKDRFVYMGTNIETAFGETNLHSNDIMATTTYTYLNKGKLSLGIGLALGYGIQRGSFYITDTTGYTIRYNNIPFDNKIVCDIRFVEAKVNLGSGFGLYGCVGTRSAIAAGLHYTFNNHKEY